MTITKITKEQAEKYRNLYSEHVTHPDGHWKGQAIATVPKEIAQDVADAMDFMGSLVDSETEIGDKVKIVSAGYWAHGF